MKYLKRVVQLCALGIFCFSCGVFKESKKKSKSKNGAAIISSTGSKAADSTKKAKTGKLKAYEELISKKAISRKGLFDVHIVDDRYFFEIPMALMETDLLIVNRIAKGAVGASMGMMGYAGDQINESVVRFAKGPNHKLFVKSISYNERSSDSTENGMYLSVLNSGMQPIVAAFDVKALNKDSSALVIDVTDYLNGENEVLFFNNQMKTALKLSGLQADKSFIASVKPFAENVEIKTVKTFTKTPQAVPGGAPSGGGNATYEINSSIILLPKHPMNPRLYDERVGYFARGYVDFDRNPQGVEETGMITRWRLEPKKEDEARYLKGELVEPKQPIVFYIDPATPKKWVPYLAQGVSDWNIAFEAAGFKNAVIVKPVPSVAEDSTWNIESARHNVIVYKPSAIANAMGPHVHDPRTGEILETHISWYHNVMQLLRNWYFIQASAVDPKARKMKFDDELMGQLIRFVSSHEVGHTLGLRHNYGSSSTVPVEKLRDKAWVEANGHTPSIMDYARFNYVAQPEDSISEKGIFPRIGDYDKWAIEWGYRWWPQLSKEEEASKLNDWIIARTSANKRLWFGHETDSNDPRSQNEDLGDNAMKAGSYGIKNLQRIVPHLAEWTKEKNEGYGNLKTMYDEVYNQYSRYIGHVLKNIGGIMTTPKAVEEKGAVYSQVTASRQKEAMKWLEQQVFKTPVWLLNREVIEKAGVDPMVMISSLQGSVLSKLLSNDALKRLIYLQVRFPKDAYSPVNYLADLERMVWPELGQHTKIDVYKRNLQMHYLINLIKLSGLGPQAPAAAAPAGYEVVQMYYDTVDISTLAKVQLRALQRKIKGAVLQASDEMTKNHLRNCLDKINRAVVMK